MLHGEGRRDKKAGRGDAKGVKPPVPGGAPLMGKPPFIGGFERMHTPDEAAPEEEQKAAADARKNTAEIETPQGAVQLENYCPADKLDELTVDEGIRMFSRNNPERQKTALVNVARLEGGNIIAGIKDNLLVSYVGIHHPSERERWGKPGYDWLYELGAIEVSRNFRELGLSEAMLDLSFDDPFYDDKIVLTTAFTWHWDLEATGMDKMQYRELFLHLAAKYGFIEMATDEPNITMDSANLFLVRLGKDSSFSKYQRFASLLYSNEWEAMLRGF